MAKQMAGYIIHLKECFLNYFSTKTMSTYNPLCNKALMHEVLLVPETKSRDTNIPNSINAIIEQDTKTYIP